VFPLVAALLFAIFHAGLPVSADEGNWTEEAKQTITRVRKAIEDFDRQSGSPELLNGWARELSSVRLQAQKCIDNVKDNLATLNQQVDAAKGSDSAVTDKDIASEKAIRERLAKPEEQLQLCRIISIDAGMIIDQLKELQATILRTYLLSRGGNIVDISVSNVLQAGNLYALGKSLVQNRLQLDSLRNIQWLILVLLTVIASAGGIWWRQWILRRLTQAQAQAQTAGYTAALMTALQSCTARYLPLLLPMVAALAWLVYLFPGTPVAPSVVLLISLLVFLTGSLVIRVFLDPCPPARHFLEAGPAYCRSLGKHLYGVLSLILAAVLFYGLGIREILSPEQWLMVRAVFLSMAVLILLWLVIAMRKAPAPFNSRKLQGLLILILLVSLGAEFAGYRNLSVYLLSGLVGSTLLGSGLWVANILLLEIFDGLDDGRFHWERKLRTSLRLAPDEPFPGLIWLRLLSTLAVWLIFTAGLFVLWGYDESLWVMLRDGFVGGFQVAGMQVTPLNLVIAIAVFALLVTLVRWIRNEILPGWVARFRISRGAREAIITMSGYVGIILAALIGLSLAGFNFTNLAIVVGALSVGIGFGLQNIVNNFISGIILLFERPIRTGDWVVVGNTEGYVRKISIRSTQIETFDRADVIVPNSELISNQVTNWMLNDPMGRVIVPIGVAYGTDVERLRELLLQVAREHPLVIKEGSKVSPPKVLFRGFGDNSLNFELRAFISMVDQRLSTLSDLNFAIERTLREAGIQIPFPQRDLHLRSADPSINFVSRPKD
jgi:small-conductance mechanosensitive channel